MNKMIDGVTAAFTKHPLEGEISLLAGTLPVLVVLPAGRPLPVLAGRGLPLGSRIAGDIVGTAQKALDYLISPLAGMRSLARTAFRRRVDV